MSHQPTMVLNKAMFVRQTLYDNIHKNMHDVTRLRINKIIIQVYTKLAQATINYFLRPKKILHLELLNQISSLLK
jgi:hypothetical protein